MKTLNYQKVEDPSVSQIDEGTHVTVFLDPQVETVVIPDPADPEKTVEVEETRAIHLRVKKPLTRARAINEAEMQAYNLADALEVASFGTSLARKARANKSDPEVKEHDEFITWAKQKLTEAGITE
jgi:hypothetical protein